MSSGEFALGIDVGTGGVRTAVMDKGGAVLTEANAAMAEFGEDRRDPVIWRMALEAALTRTFEEIAPERIGAVCVDGTSGTVLGLDREGGAVGTALMYNDAVDDAAIPAAIAAVAPRESAAHGASSALARATVLQDRTGVVRIVHQADWIASLLAGAPLPTDESNALKTGYDPVAREWPAWIDETPMRSALLPEVIASGTQSGMASGRYGLSPDTVIVAGMTDGCASFLATGASVAGDGVTALGTTLTIKLLCEQPIFAPEFGIYSHRLNDIWLAGGASNTGGGVIAQFFDEGEISALSAGIDPAVESGLDYYPLREPGERFPVSDPGYAPRLDPRPDNDSAFLHGMLEGIARIEALGYRRLAELGAPALRSIRSVGGGSKNAVWTAMRGRILGVPGAKAESTSAAAGVARLALGHLAK